MKVWVLGSGSRGNAVLIEAAGTRVLVDAGFVPRVLAERLAAIDVAPESIEALVVTHEHSDHVSGARSCADRYGWSVYGTAGTILGARDLRDVAIPFAAGDTIAIGDVDVTAIRSPHDAAEPVVLVATARRTGARVGVAYDMGCVTEPVAAAMRDLDLLVLEANHDDAMLHHGPYPPVVRARIAGRNGHLSNAAAGRLARQVSHPALRHVVLAHLSETCNEPALAVRMVSESLARGRFKGRVSAAAQDAVVGPFEPGARRPAAVQLQLGI